MSVNSSAVPMILLITVLNNQLDLYTKRPYSYQIRENMKFFFFILSTSISLGFDQTKESNESLWLKLTNYQNVTGISDNIKLSIWQQSRAFGSERKLNRRRRAASQGTFNM